MIKNPFMIAGILLGIESFVLWMKGRPRFEKYFRALPHVFWIYFLPMLAASAGLIDAGGPVLGRLTRVLLPACLFLLLLPVDIKALMRLGRPALIMMFCGSLGIMLGTTVAYLLFRNVVGPEFWSGFGALSGSWTGGSANMIAVKEAVGTPEKIFAPMVVVDTILPYAWMGLLVAFGGWQARFDRWVRVKKEILTDLETRIGPSSSRATQPLRILPVVGLVLLSLAVGRLAGFLAGFCPEMSGVFSVYTWTIIVISTLGILASFTHPRRLERVGATKTGYFLLYFVLTLIGARARLSGLSTTAPLLLAGAVILAVHAGVLVLAARLMRAPLFLAAVASQANVGGVASGPIIAEIYRPGFASAGLLLAIFGNIMGTYFGILTAQICRIF